MQWSKKLNRRIVVIGTIVSMVFSVGYYLVLLSRDPDVQDAYDIISYFAGNPIDVLAADGKTLSLPADSLKLIDADCERLSSYGRPSASRTATRQPLYRCTGTYTASDGARYRSIVTVRYIGHDTSFHTMRGFIQMPKR